jgi:hypothetical protein
MQATPHSRGQAQLREVRNFVNSHSAQHRAKQPRTRHAVTKSSRIRGGAWPQPSETLGGGKLAAHFAEFLLARAERIDDVRIELLARLREDLAARR